MPDASTRYARQLALRGFTDAEQKRLDAATVLLVGLGGLGCPAAQYLAGAGVGRLVLNDFDTVRISNLHRQTLYGDALVGERKLSAAAQRLGEINPEVSITVVDQRLDDPGLNEQVRDADLVLDATDNFATRIRINAACVMHATPLVSGAAAGLDGQVGVYPCDRTGPCYQCFAGDADDELGDCEAEGILGPVTGVIGSMMALEAIKLITRIGRALTGQLLHFDGRIAEWRTLRIGRSANCPTCSQQQPAEMRARSLQ